MFALRRAALRALIQPNWQASRAQTLPCPRTLQIQTTASLRSFRTSSFHLAEERQTSTEQAPSSNSPQGEADVTTARAESSASDASHYIPSTSTAQQSKGGILDQVAEVATKATGAVRDTFSGERSSASTGQALFVGNIFFDVTSSELEEAFAPHGKIVSCTIVKDDQMRSKGFGFVNFARKEDAERAMEALNQKQLHGRRIVVHFQTARSGPPQQRPAFRREQSPPSKTLYIGNMSFQMSDRDVNDLFRDVPNVFDVRLAIDRRTGQPRGFAHAEFNDIASAQRAKEVLEQRIVHGRRLRIDFSQTREREELS